MKEKMAKTNQSVEKVFDIIEVMAKNELPMRLQDIAREAGMPASTTLRLINTLVTYGYANQNIETLKYSLSLKFALIGSIVASKNSMRTVVRPYLLHLAEQCGESCCLAVEENMETVYLDTVESPDSLLRITQRIGKRAPMHCTGVGKCMLLNYSDSRLEELARQKGLAKLTEHTIDTVDKLKAEIELTRKRGFCFDNEECELGARCIAAPFRDYTGRIVGAISISGPLVRMTAEKIERFEGLLLQTVGQIEQALGYCALG